MIDRLFGLYEKYRESLGEIFRYGVIGVGNCLLSIMLGLFFVQFMEINLSTLLCYLLVTGNGYYWNKVWTYKLKGFNFKDLIRYYSLYAGTTILNMVINSLFVYKFGIDERITVVSVTFIMIIVNFFGQRFFAFKRK